MKVIGKIHGACINFFTATIARSMRPIRQAMQSTLSREHLIATEQAGGHWGLGMGICYSPLRPTLELEIPLKLVRRLLTHFPGTLPHGFTQALRHRVACGRMILRIEIRNVGITRFVLQLTPVSNQHSSAPSIGGLTPRIRATNVEPLGKLMKMAPKTTGAPKSIDARHKMVFIILSLSRIVSGGPQSCSHRATLTCLLPFITKLHGSTMVIVQPQK